MDTEIVVCYYDYDINWLNKLEEYPVNVIRKKNPTAPPFKLKSLKAVYDIDNISMIGICLYTFIVERYDSLPERVIILHGHETSHHQQLDLVEAIRDAPKNIKYVGLNGMYIFLKVNDIKTWSYDYRRREHLTHFIGKDPGNIRLSYDGNCQFIIHKDLLLRRPKEYYQQQIEYFKTHFVPGGHDPDYAWDSVCHYVLTGEKFYKPVYPSKIDIGLVGIDFFEPDEFDKEDEEFLKSEHGVKLKMIVDEAIEKAIKSSQS